MKDAMNIYSSFNQLNCSQSAAASSVAPYLVFLFGWLEYLCFYFAWTFSIPRVTSGGGQRISWPLYHPRYQYPLLCKLGHS